MGSRPIDIYWNAEVFQEEMSGTIAITQIADICAPEAKKYPLVFCTQIATYLIIPT
jgi:hypothetical protein